ncbi:hypothetical protein M422DRAFT_268717 [Sphaerobolus stellatus SS14]|uniref:Uncharacterized protein n=1 Tax=Sphaerobolus stellatus (strain SS14) TaxID=990650 RepID=A0A0C9TJP3_SPHS4|nr:hypothetical protein M422DRAFT_268717 [Sphaerobolus stellatus SS14]
MPPVRNTRKDVGIAIIREVDQLMPAEEAKQQTRALMSLTNIEASLINKRLDKPHKHCSCITKQPTNPIFPFLQSYLPILPSNPTSSAYVPVLLPNPTPSSTSQSCPPTLPAILCKCRLCLRGTQDREHEDKNR